MSFFIGFILGAILGLFMAAFISGAGKTNKIHEYYNEGFLDGYNAAEKRGIME